MTIEHLLAFNAALLVAILSPGPALLVAIQATLSAGCRAGIATGAGLGLMAATWTLFALVGLEAVFQYFPWAYGAVKMTGALYLLYIAWKMWTGASRSISFEQPPALRSFRLGVLVNALNAKSVLFAAAVLVVVFPADRSALDSALVVLNHVVVEVVFYSVLALGLSTTAFRTRYLKAKTYIDRVASVVLGTLGLRLLFGR